MTKKIIYRLLRYSGLPLLFRLLIQQRKVTILLFHDISPEIAKQSFTFLKKKYNLISLRDFIRNRDLKIKLPKKSIIITFDDGHINNHKLLPIIKELNIPITIFLTMGLINTNRHFWFKSSASKNRTQILKKMTNDKKLEILKKSDFEPTREFNEPQALSDLHVKEMLSFVDFQSHTMFHPCLPKVGNKETEFEIQQSKLEIEERYQKMVYALAYPNGDYSERDILTAKKSGYKCGITVDYGFNNSKTDLFRLKRFSVNDTGDINEFIVKASGVWGFFKNIVRKKQYGYSRKYEE